MNLTPRSGWVALVHNLMSYGNRFWESVRHRGMTRVAFQTMRDPEPTGCTVSLLLELVRDAIQYPTTDICSIDNLSYSLSRRATCITAWACSRVLSLALSPTWNEKLSTLPQIWVRAAFNFRSQSYHLNGRGCKFNNLSLTWRACPSILQTIRPLKSAGVWIFYSLACVCLIEYQESFPLPLHQIWLAWFISTGEQTEVPWNNKMNKIPADFPVGEKRRVTIG